MPQECVGEVGSYMEGPQYGADTYGEINNTEAFLETVTLTGDGKDVVVFDIDETSLSNLPYYRTHEYGYVGHSIMNQSLVMPNSDKDFSILTSFSVRFF